MLNDKTKFNSAEVEQHLAAFGRAAQSAAPTFRDGEITAGLILEPDSGNTYHLVLMPGELINVTWDQAQTIFAATGGDLPDACEMALLNSNLLKEFDIDEQYWSSEVGRLQGETVDTVMYHSFGADGCFEFTSKDDAMRARGVRRVPVDVPVAPTVSPGPYLSDLPVMQRMREEFLKPAQPVTARDIIDTQEYLNAIIDADNYTGLVPMVCQKAVNTINGLMVIADVEKLTGTAIKSEPVTANMSVGAAAPGLQQLREELHPSLLPLYPELLTSAAAPPTRREVIAVLEQLDALSSLTGISKTALFAMDVIGSLVAMIDVKRLV